MEQYGIVILQYLLKVLVATSMQLFVLIGPLLVLALIMHFISKANENLSYKVFGEKVYLYLFGWLGTSIHELGHAIFCPIFGHTITEMKLFSVNPKNGSLGHVAHSFNKKNIYQNIGNFFIGLGPILLGSFMLFIAIYFLFGTPEGINQKINIQINTFTSFTVFKIEAMNTWQSITLYIHWIINTPTITWWKITLVFYILYSIGSSITLSPSDIKSAVSGLMFFVLFLLIFNILTLWIGGFTLDFFKKSENLLSGFYFLIVLSMFVNIVFIGVLIIANIIKTVVSGK
jgi:hypothetical protein